MNDSCMQIILGGKIKQTTQSESDVNQVRREKRERRLVS